MKVLIDSDVLLDIALDRSPYAQHSEQALNKILTRNWSINYTPIIVANLIYLLSKHASKATAKHFVSRILSFGELLPITSKTILDSFKQNPKDLEDGIQIQAARDSSLDLILTRNLKDYQPVELEVLSPEQFLLT